MSCNEIHEETFGSHKDQEDNLKADAEYQQRRAKHQKELLKLENKLQELKDKE